MEPVTSDTLLTFLARLGERCARETRLYLLGGSALRLLGSPRETLDVDYTAGVPAEMAQAFQQAMTQLANEFRLDLEEVPLAEFLPKMQAPSPSRCDCWLCDKELPHARSTDPDPENRNQ